MDSLAEEDLQLVDAVQLNPRASWEKIGATIGLSAVTAGRRWRQLGASGAAWTGSTLGSGLFRGGFAEILCRPGTTEAVAAALCDMPDVITVGRSIGSFDLYAITVSPLPVPVSEALMNRLADLPVDLLRVQMYTVVYGGPDWRLSVLNRSQSDQMRQESMRLMRRSAVDDMDRRLFTALFADARRTFVDLAGDLGSSPQAVRRRLEQMQHRGQIAFRADLARPLAGWPLAALLWIAAPDEQVHEIGRWLAACSENRFCARVVSASNLVVIVNVRLPDHLATLVLDLASKYPQAKLIEQRMILRLLKVHGRVLDQQGRSTRVVPVDPWETAYA